MTRPWVVTGAAGFLGSHVVEHLLARETPVLAIDDLSVGLADHIGPHHGKPGFTFARGDVRDLPWLTTLFQDHKPAVVIHLAALHFIPWCINDPTRCVSLNVHGTQAVLSACRAANVERFWFASTGDVYAPDEQPHHETRSTLAPFNIYGLSKRMGEQLIDLESRSRPEARFVIGRLFNLYGPRETNPHILPEIFKQMRESPDHPLKLGSLWPRRDLVPVADAGRAVIAMLDVAKPGVTTANVASGTARSMQEVIDLIGEIRRKALPVETDPAKIRPVERAHLEADVSALREMIGWAPHGDLKRGLTELLAAERLL